MRTGKLLLLLLLNLAVAIGAGVVAARAWANRASTDAHEGSSTPDSTLAAQLQLSTEQSAKMRPIWEAARDVARDCAREADQIQKGNDASLQALLTEPQKAQYEQISAEHKRRIDAQDARRKAAFKTAVDQTRAILRPDQWQAYEQILKSQVGEMP